MRRADRLFDIIEELRRRKQTTAARLAERLEVSERTIYRDIADLTASGVPIEGEAGVGYRLGKGFDLPPLMFDATELEALVLGMRMVACWGDDELKHASERALAKVEAVLPTSRRPAIAETSLFAVNFRGSGELRARFTELRRAVRERRRTQLRYEDGSGVVTTRVIRPLGLYFFGAAWTIGAWCELRADHRAFRIDRIAEQALLDDTFEHVTPVTLEEFTRAMRES